MQVNQLKSLIERSKKFNVLFVEDDDALRESTANLFSTFFATVVTAVNGKEGLEKFKQRDWDIVISDLNMPVMNGLEMVREIKRKNPEQVVLITSAHDEAPYLLDLIDMGIDNFIVKPLDIEKLLQVVEKTIHFLELVEIERNYKKSLEEQVLLRTQDLNLALEALGRNRRELVEKLCTAAEYKDNDTGKHIRRIGLYAQKLGGKMGLKQEFCDLLLFAAPLHDIGKIGITDAILHKPSRHTPEEWEVMASHAQKGANILRGSGDPAIQMAEKIARSHHEKWDGQGYPEGIGGKAIPLEARVTQICDIYDALLMKRPYKKALPHQEVVRIIREGDGRTEPGHFDPQVWECFLDCAEELHQIYLNHQDPL